jgi:hypothetical protein
LTIALAEKLIFYEPIAVNISETAASNHHKKKN